MGNLVGLTAKRNRRAQKIKTVEQIIEENFLNAEKQLTEEEFYERLNNEKSNNKGRTRLNRIERNLRNGRTVKPCGRECHSWGHMIIATSDHSSMKYAKSLVNDREFLLKAGRKTASPRNCKNFFYGYINKYLRMDENFRLSFLRALYLNDNLFTSEDIMCFVETFHFEKENRILTKDYELFTAIKEKFNEYFTSIPLKWDNIDEKNAVRRYVKYNNKVNNEYEERLASLLSLFKDFFKVEKKEKSKHSKEYENPIDEDDDLKDFYITDDGSWHGFT